MEEKPCSKCKVVKPTTEFRRLYEGYRSECKACYKLYVIDNKETIKKKKAEYYKKKKEENMNADQKVDWESKYNAVMEENKKLRKILDKLEYDDDFTFGDKIAYGNK